MEKITTSKQEIRSRHLAMRDRLSHSERVSKSAQIRELLKREESFEKAQIILAYMDYRSEVMTTELVTELLSDSSKRVFVPKVEGMDIRFYEITSLEELTAGYQGIREPVPDSEKLFTEKTAVQENCLLIMPGAVYDRNRERMGYGKGFYDRFVHKFPDMPRVGLAFACQIAARIPVESHDQKADFVVTEKGVIR